MSINLIKLPINTVSAFYKNNLVRNIKPGKLPAPQQNDAFAVLGNNEKKITIIVNDEHSMYLPDSELQFLTGILSACNLTMNDISILNIQKNPTADYISIQYTLQSSTVLMFGTTPVQIGLPVNFPQYQIQQYNNQTYLIAPKLTLIEQEKSEKLKLWNALKQIFSIV